MNVKSIWRVVCLTALGLMSAGLVACGGSDEPTSSVSMSVAAPESIAKSLPAGETLVVRITPDGDSSKRVERTATLKSDGTVAADLSFELTAGSHTLEIAYLKQQGICTTELAHTTDVPITVVSGATSTADFSHASLIYEDSDKDGYNNLGEYMANADACDAAKKPAAPAVVTNRPNADAVNVAQDAPIVVTFSTTVNATSIDANSFIVIDQNGGAISGNAAVDALSAFRIVFTPTQPLAPNTTYIVTITKDVTDTSGTKLGTGAEWRFSTGGVVFFGRPGSGIDTTPPQLAGVEPSVDASNIALGAVIVATFSEGIDAASATTGVAVTDSTGNNIPGNATVSGSAVTFTPTNPWTHNTQYNVAITTAIKDTSGNALANGKSWSFTTVAAPPPPALLVTGIQPTDKSIGVAVDSSVIVNFSTDVDANSVTTTSIHVEDSNKNNVPATPTVSGNVVTLKPQINWSPNTGYKVVVTTSLAASGGGTLAQEFNSTFDTTPAPPPASKAQTDFAISREVSVARLPPDLSINSVVSREVSVGRQP